MPTDILMPALSPTMTEGTLSRWLKSEGDSVAPGDVIAEIETDKATMEVEAVDEGRIGRILVREGTEGVAVNTPIAVLLAEGENASGDPPVSDAASAPASAQAAPQSALPAAPATSPPAQGGAPSSTTAAPAGKAAGTNERIFASPLARRVARENGVSLDTITGTGPHGRILRADVEAAASAPAPGLQASASALAASSRAAPAPAARAPASPATVPDAPHKAVANSSMRRAIARRLSQSLAERPHIYVTVDIELDAMLDVRARLNALAPEGEGAFKLSVNDMLIKAAAVAHRRVPGLAVTYTDDAILHWENIDISVAVAIPDGLITPIVRNADRKGLAAISNEVKELVGRARAGKLKPAEFEGGAFSISNLGMFGVREFTAIINPPQAAILAFGAGEKRPVVRGDALAVATVMSATLSVDHRAIDGALTARYLAAFKALVQEPLELML